MTTSTSASFPVLHTLRVKGLAAADAVHRHTGLAPKAVDDALAELAAAGAAEHRDGRMAGWRLTPSGKDEHAQVLDTLRPTGATAAELRDHYLQEFLPLNQRLKETCTAWQLRDGAVNDHADAAYDASVVELLGAVHAEVEALCARLQVAVPHLAPYGPRLHAALERLRAGDRDAFTRPLSDSYHDVWMELHEDLILTLGVERTADDA